MLFHCISFLGLLLEITTRLVAQNNIKFFNYISGGQKPELSLTELNQGGGRVMIPLKTQRENLFPCFSISRAVFFALLSSWIFPSSLEPPAHHLLSSNLLSSYGLLLQFTVNSPSYKDTCAHRDDPG